MPLERSWKKPKRIGVILDKYGRPTHQWRIDETDESRSSRGEPYRGDGSNSAQSRKNMNTARITFSEQIEQATLKTTELKATVDISGAPLSEGMPYGYRAHADDNRMHTVRYYNGDVQLRFTVCGIEGQARIPVALNPEPRFRKVSEDKVELVWSKLPSADEVLSREKGIASTSEVLAEGGTEWDIPDVYDEDEPQTITRPGPVFRTPQFFRRPAIDMGIAVWGRMEEERCVERAAVEEKKSMAAFALMAMGDSSNTPLEMPTRGSKPTTISMSMPSSLRNASSTRLPMSRETSDGPEELFEYDLGEITPLSSASSVDDYLASDGEKCSITVYR
ncbi:hypothetical protein BJ508DRAFT_412820 [Ascobolus immersus RN42]|uniref:Uncharacterized protein n=1 Tax=Ascobolus immersus RN42 TaxID=1160509 RepID=A0A3N4IJV1_ASCIM|nr:hypothetical protein BJ508DRAFT_412820 [Ascobolus immersus RN42]